MDEKEVDKSLEINIRDGHVEHVGFDKKGEDLFRLTGSGFKHIEATLTEDPNSVMFLLNIAKSNGKESFYKMLKHLYDLITSK